MADKYDKVEIIGSGSFGKAWLALRVDNGRRYVLKEIQVVGMSEKAKKQALTEVTALATCKHINVIRYKEAFVHKGALWIAMEYADGGDLHRIISKSNTKPLETTKILDWFVQICFALQYIHGCNIIHRDLKTQNIFLTTTGLIKVGDLGIARILKQNEEHANTAVGTPYYLSPEICKRQPYDYKTDMWAAGCVLYELCSGKRPFAGPSCFSSLVLNIIQGKYVPLPQKCGPILADLVHVLLKVNPDSRPTAEQTLSIPSLKPYVTAYVQRTKLLKDQRALASPSVPAARADKVDHPSTPVHTPVSSKSARVRKPSLSTPRPSLFLPQKRAVHSAVCTRKVDRTPGGKEAVPMVSLYQDVLRKRQPLAVLATSNTPVKDRSSFPDSPVANRTRKRTSPELRHRPGAGISSASDSLDALRQEVYMCHLATCTFLVEHVYGNMETVRVFLESKLGPERFDKLFRELKQQKCSRLDVENFCMDQIAMICFPLVIHLVQLESMAKMSC